MEPSEDLYQKFLIISNNIDIKLKKIKDDTSFYSSFQPMYDHPDYIELLNLGPSICPYLIHRACMHGFTWVTISLLYRLLDDKTGPRTFIKNCSYWADYYDKNFSNSGIYLNLV